MTPEIIVALIIAALGSGGLTGAVVALATLYAGRGKQRAEGRKIDAETNGVHATNWRTLVDELQEETGRLGARLAVMEETYKLLAAQVAELRIDVQTLCIGVNALTAQAVKEGLIPDWLPPPDLAARHGLTPPAVRLHQQDGGG